jgi:fucose 4-O-acetylase-like acetyltransferase
LAGGEMERVVKERDGSVDVLRGLGILLVVSGHASSGSGLYQFSPYSFHMPLFFFISGLFFSELKIERVSHVLLKNIRSLLLYSTGFYFFYAFMCMAISSIGFKAFDEPFSLQTIFLNQFVTGGAYKFTSAYWFIPCLFFVKIYFSVIHVRLASAVNSIRSETSPAVFFAVYLIVAFLAVVYSFKMYAANNVQWPEVQGLRVAFAAFFYYLGFLFAKYRLQRFASHAMTIAILFIVQQQLWVYSGNLDYWMQVSKFQSTYLPVITSTIAIVFFYGLSVIASKNESWVKVVGHIGKNSFPILLHHLFGFFVINAILCALGVITPADVKSQYFQYDTVHSWPFYIGGAVIYSLAFDRYVVVPLKDRVKGRRFMRRFKNTA